MNGYPGFQQYYINHKKEERECSICREIKPFERFSQRNGRPKSHCKLCHTDKEREYRAIRQRKETRLFELLQNDGPVGDRYY